MRIILDSNVFISGIFWKDAPNEIIKLAEKGKLEIFTTDEILKELLGVLQRKKFNFLFKEAKTSINEVSEKILELVKICKSAKEIRIITDFTFYPLLEFLNYYLVFTVGDWLAGNPIVILNEVKDL